MTSNGSLASHDANAPTNSTPVPMVVATMLTSLAGRYEGEERGETGSKRCEAANMMNLFKVLHHALLISLVVEGEKEREGCRAIPEKGQRHA